MILETMATIMAAILLIFLPIIHFQLMKILINHYEIQKLRHEIFWKSCCVNDKKEV